MARPPADDDDDELVYEAGDDDDVAQDDPWEDAASDDPCNHKDYRFDDVADMWYEVDPQDAASKGNGIGFLSYGHRGSSSKSRDAKHIWVQVMFCSGSDYDNCGILCKSNFRVLYNACQEAMSDPDTCAEPWWLEVSGGHGTYGLLLHALRAPDAIAELVEGLNDHPILDDDHHSELEQEGINESWDNWAADDYKRALKEQARNPQATTPSVELDLDDVSDEALREHFSDAADRANEYWHDDGGSMHIDVDKVAEFVVDHGMSYPEGAITSPYPGGDDDDDDDDDRDESDTDEPVRRSSTPGGGGYDIDLDGLGAASGRAMASLEDLVTEQEAAFPGDNNHIWSSPSWSRKGDAVFYAGTGADYDNERVRWSLKRVMHAGQNRISLFIMGFESVGSVNLTGLEIFATAADDSGLRRIADMLAAIGALYGAIRVCLAEQFPDETYEIMRTPGDGAWGRLSPGPNSAFIEDILAKTNFEIFQGEPQLLGERPGTIQFPASTLADITHDFAAIYTQVCAGALGEHQRYPDTGGYNISLDGLGAWPVRTSELATLIPYRLIAEQERARAPHLEHPLNQHQRAGCVALEDDVRFEWFVSLSRSSGTIWALLELHSFVYGGRNDLLGFELLIPVPPGERESMMDALSGVGAFYCAILACLTLRFQQHASAIMGGEDILDGAPGPGRDYVSNKLASISLDIFSWNAKLTQERVVDLLVQYTDTYAEVCEQGTAPAFYSGGSGYDIDLDG